MCMFCRSLFVLLFIFFWPLCCLFFFDQRILITPLVSSSSSFTYCNAIIKQYLDIVLNMGISTYIHMSRYCKATLKNMFVFRTRPSISPMGRQVGGFFFYKISKTSFTGAQLQCCVHITQILFLHRQSKRKFWKSKLETSGHDFLQPKYYFFKRRRQITQQIFPVVTCLMVDRVQETNKYLILASVEYVNVL